jgi:protein SCO1/2
MNLLTGLLMYSLLTVVGCESNKSNDRLPILGRHDITNGDTTFHTVPDFELVDQRGRRINKETLRGKIFLVDDFFTSCPTICPKVKQQELRIFNRFKADSILHFLSISIDHRRDSVPVLLDYANKLGIDHNRWHLTTGEKDHIYDIVEGFFLIALEAEDAPGGFDHSGALILVDDQFRIRAVCSDGTDPETVDAFMPKIQQLINEVEGS